MARRRFETRSPQMGIVSNAGLVPNDIAGIAANLAELDAEERVIVARIAALGCGVSTGGPSRPKAYPWRAAPGRHKAR